jgi:Uma2 family endonuclease
MGAVSQKFEYHVERIRGQEIEKPLPKRLHAILQKRIMLELAKLETAGRFEVLPELDMLTGGGDWVVPDITVAAVDAPYDSGKLAGPAELAVEIMSPGQTIGQLFDKCEILHAGGTKHCWVIWPAKRTAWRYDAGELPVIEERELIAGEIRLAVPPLFADLPDEAEN